MIKLKSFSYKKGDKYVTMIPRFGIVKVTNRKFDLVELYEESLKQLDDIVDDIRMKRLKDRHIDSLFIILNSYCPGRCTYCYAHSERENNNVVTIDTIKNVLNQYNVKDLRSVIIYGGEPLSNFDELVDIITWLKVNYKNTIKDIHVVTSLFVDYYTFLKFVSFARNNGVTFTVSIDPKTEGKPYPRVYKETDDSYKFVLDRIYAMAYDPKLLFGVRATVSDNAHSTYRLFKDLKKAARPITINFDLIKYKTISRESLQDAIDGLVNNSNEIINHYIDAGSGIIFHSTFNKLLNGASLIDILKNCDGYIRRISITPYGGVDICNERVSVKHKINLNDIKFSDIYPFNDRCENCNFKGACGFMCFNYKYPDISYCTFHTSLFLESFRQFVKLKTLDEIESWINSHPINNVIELEVKK